MSDRGSYRIDSAGRLRSRHASGHDVPVEMLRGLVGARAREVALEHAQLEDALDVELFPSMRLAAAARAADLVAKQRLLAVANAVVVGFDDAHSSGPVDEGDESFLCNGA